MYRVESFLTSFILSYADKYIKNFKRSDAQLSLWEGQACFHNLELDLEALESLVPLRYESLVPFHFVSGHINELKIKVPWTSLGSSSVEVVIDTIECVMKFKTSQNEEDGAHPSTSSNIQKDNEPSRSPSPTLDPNLTPMDPAAGPLPPTVRRVLSNLKIVCNNVILKIIEEDTVLSLNIKTIECGSVDQNWLPAFIELSAKDLFLRKRITLADITICLDRRASSGHIVTFLEPLLFKCSLEMRLCQQFDRANHSSRLTRLDIRGDQMSYIVSKPQLYLLLKIVDLVINLRKVISNNKIRQGSCSPVFSNPSSPGSPPSSPRPSSPSPGREVVGGMPTSPAALNERDREEGGWWGWLWQYAPSLLEGAELGPTPSRENVTGHTLRIGLYIKQLKVSLKLLENSHSMSTDKMKYSQLMSLQLDGLFMELTSHNNNWFNVQAGIDSFFLSSCGACPCGHLSSDSETLMASTSVVSDSTTLYNLAPHLSSKPACSKWHRSKHKLSKGCHTWGNNLGTTSGPIPLAGNPPASSAKDKEKTTVADTGSRNPTSKKSETTLATEEMVASNDVGEMLQDERIWSEDGGRLSNDIILGEEATSRVMVEKNLSGNGRDESVKTRVVSPREEEGNKTVPANDAKTSTDTTDQTGESASSRPGPHSDEPLSPPSSDQRENDPFLEGSLFSAHVKFVPLSKPFWKDHLASLEETVMLSRSRTLCIDLVKSLEVMGLDEKNMRESEEGEIDDGHDVAVLQEKMLLRCVLGPIQVKVNPSLLHRVTYLSSLLDEALLSIRRDTSTLDEKIAVTLSDETLEMYCAGYIPFNIIQIAIFHPTVELHPMVHAGSTSQTAGPGVQAGPCIKLVVQLDLADIRVTFPMHGELVRAFLERTGQTDNEALVTDLYRKICVDVTDLAVLSCCISKTGDDANKQLEPVLSSPQMSVMITSNQFYDREVFNFCDLITSQQHDADAPAQDMQFSLANKNVQMNCNFESAQLHINMQTYHITSHVLTSLAAFLSKTARNMQRISLSREDDQHTVSLQLTNVNLQCVHSPLYTYLNLTATSLSGNMHTRNPLNQIIYVTTILQSEKLVKMEKSSDRQDGTCPSQSESKIFETAESQSVQKPQSANNLHPVLSFLVQIPHLCGENGTFSSPIDLVPTSILGKHPCTKIPPILVVKLSGVSGLMDVHLYDMVNSWQRLSVIGNASEGVFADAPNTQNSSGIGLSRQVSSGAGSTSSGVFATPPVSLEHTPSLVDPPPEQDSVFSSPPLFPTPDVKEMDVQIEPSKSSLLKHYSIWKCLILSISLDNLSVYLPIKPLANSSDVPFHKLDTNMVVLKLPRTEVQSYNRNISVEKLPTVIFDPAVWSSDNFNFPWSINMSGVISYTTSKVSASGENRMELYLLKPLDVNCSIAVNVKQEPVDVEKCQSAIPVSSIAFTIHLNTSRVDVNVCEPQVDLINQLLSEYLLELVSNLRSLDSWSCAAATGDVTRSVIDTPHQDVKVSALVQWTLARLCLHLRTVTSTPGEECRKISLQMEELILSMDYQPPSYQMLKFKVASAQVFHFKRASLDDPWLLGDYRGVIMKANELESRLPGGGTEDSNAGFLSVTLTRANSDNLHSKIGTRDRVQKFNNFLSIPAGHFTHITELIIKVQPLDFILAPSTIATFLSILSPLIRSSRTSTRPKQLLTSKSATYLGSIHDNFESESKISKEYSGSQLKSSVALDFHGLASVASTESFHAPDSYNQRENTEEIAHCIPKSELTSDVIISEEIRECHVQSNIPTLHTMGDQPSSSKTPYEKGRSRFTNTNMTPNRGENLADFPHSDIPNFIPAYSSDEISHADHLFKEKENNGDQKTSDERYAIKEVLSESTMTPLEVTENNTPEDALSNFSERRNSAISRETPLTSLVGRKKTPPDGFGLRRLRKVSSTSAESSDYVSVHRKTSHISAEKSSETVLEKLEISPKNSRKFIADSTEKLPKSLVETVPPCVSSSTNISYSQVFNERDNKFLMKHASQAPTHRARSQTPPHLTHQPSFLNEVNRDVPQKSSLPQNPSVKKSSKDVPPSSTFRKTPTPSILKKTSTSSSLGNESSTKKVSIDVPPTCVHNIVRSPSQQTGKVPFLSTAKLPLFFLDMKSIRIIIPVETYGGGIRSSARKCCDGAEEPMGKAASNGSRMTANSDRRTFGNFTKNNNISLGNTQSKHSQSENSSDSARKGSSDGRSSAENLSFSTNPSTSEDLHDTVIITLSSICISPQVENPLTRIEIRSDLMGLARKFGVVHVLGSQIEDRQYSFEVGSVKINSGIWREVERGTLLSHTSELELNAALIWNSGQTPGAPPNTLPLLREFNISATLAPCIVYLYEAVLVAGTSLELSAGKDICLSLTLAQLCLLSHLSRQFHASLSLLGKQKTGPRGHTAQCSFCSETTQTSVAVPFEMLMTGRSVQVELFESEVNIKPMICAQVIQPDLLVKANHLKGDQQITLNIYDAQLFMNKSYQETRSGCHDNEAESASLIEDPKLEPTLSEGADSIEGDKARLNKLIRDKQAALELHKATLKRDQIHLFESLPLPPRKRTENGLSPVLVKISVEKAGPALGWKRVACRVNRPVRVVVHEELLHRLNALRDEITSALEHNESSDHSRIDNEVSSSSFVKSAEDVRSADDTRSRTINSRELIEKAKAKLEAYGVTEMSISTDQLSLLINHPESDLPGGCVNLASISLTLSYPFLCQLLIRTLSVSTQSLSMDPNSSRFLLDPVDVKGSLECHWESWYPSFLLFLNGDADYVSFNLSAAQLETLTRIYHQYNHFFPPMNSWIKVSDNRADSSDSNKSADSSANSSYRTADSDDLIRGSVSQDQHYVDDLRAGAFQYIDISGKPLRLPLSYQILFNRYSITWKYPIPRSLTRIYIAPTPSMSSEEASAHQEYYVQFLEASSKRFSTYARFKVFENRDENLKIDFLDLPPAKPVSDVWRIVHEDYLDVDFSNENDTQVFRNQSEKSSDQIENIDCERRQMIKVNSVSLTDEMSDRDNLAQTCCNMTLLLGSIRIDSFYSPKLISNLHVHLRNKIFLLNFLYSPENKISYRLNQKKVIFNKFSLNRKNIELFENNDHIVAQVVSEDNQAKYNFNANFSSGLYLTMISTRSFRVNLINYNLLELKPLVEVILASVKLYNAEYRGDETGINIDLIVNEHVKLSLSNELVNSATLVRKLVNRTMNQLALLNYRQTMKDLREQKTENVKDKLSETDIDNSDNRLSEKHKVKVPQMIQTDVEATSDTVSQEAKPAQVRTADLATNQLHQNQERGQLGEAGLTVLDLNEIADPLCGGCTAGFKSRTTPNERKCDDCNCTVCFNAIKNNIENVKVTSEEDTTFTVEPGDLDLHPMDLDLKLTSVMVCNNTHFPFIVRQYDTIRESVVYSMECIYFTWSKSSPQSSSKPHWIQFNIKSVDFQWSTPLPLTGQTRGSFPLQIQGPNNKRFPVVVELSPCDNSIVLTIHGNVHCANLFNRNLNLLLFSSERENQIISVPARTVSPSVLYCPAQTTSQIEMKMKIEGCVWSGIIPLGANINKKQGSGEDIWLVKLPLKPSPSSSAPLDNVRQSSFQSVWVRLLWDYRNTNETGLIRLLLLVTPMYLIRSYLPCSSQVVVRSLNSKHEQCIPGKGRLEELRLSDCTSQDIHQVSFQLTQDTKPSTPPLQVSYRSVESPGPPYSELNIQSALDILYNYQLELPPDEDVPASYDTLEELIGKSSHQTNTVETRNKSNTSSFETTVPKSRSLRSGTSPPSRPNIWESEFTGDPKKADLQLSSWPFATRYKAMRPTETVTHIDVNYCALPLYTHCLCVHFKPWALLFNTLPVGVTLTKGPGKDGMSLRNSSVSLRDSKVSLRHSNSPESRLSVDQDTSHILCSLDPDSVLAPPRLDSSFWIQLDCHAGNSSWNTHSCSFVDARGSYNSRRSDESRRPDNSRQSDEADPKTKNLGSPSDCDDARRRTFSSGNSIELRSSQAFYTPKVSGLLFPNSYVFVDVPCDNHVAYLTLGSAEYEDIRVLNLRPTYSLANHSSYELAVQGFVVYPETADAMTRDRFQIPHNFPDVLQLKPDSGRARNGLRPLLFWKLLGTPHAPQVAPELYLIFWMGGIPLSPVPLSTLDVKRAHALVVSNQGSPVGLTLTTYVQNGVHQFRVWNQDLPQLVINNRTDVTLSVSPCYPDSIKEPPMIFDWKWYMNPQSISYYSLPQPTAPDSNSSTEVELPPLVLELEDPSLGTTSSELLILSECSGRPVHLASMDLKINIACDVRTRVVTIETASSGEFSAVDIRNRLAQAFAKDEARPQPTITEVGEFTTSSSSLTGITTEKQHENTMKIQPSPIDNGKINSNAGSIQTELKENQNHDEFKKRESNVTAVHRSPSTNRSYFLNLISKYNFNMKSYVHNLNINFLENIQQMSVTVINLEKIISVLKNNNFKSNNNTNNELNYKYTETSVTVNNIQVDNTLYKYGKYDFNVILFKNAQNTGGNSGHANVRDEFETNIDRLKRLDCVGSLMSYLYSNESEAKHFVNVRVNFHSNPRIYLMDLINVEVTSPFILRIEDTYLKRMNDYFKRLLNLRANPLLEIEDLRPFPEEPLAFAAGYELAFPLYIESILIERFSLSLCLHTSSRFYIALDNSPLTFARFERKALVTSSYRLGQSISHDYYHSAIFSTAWALGRLEFCGTPGGLASSVGTGIRDFVTLPYAALGSGGALGFLLGLYQGSGSLLRHTAGGTLTSLVKAASSWSRTLDRLTLDQEDLEHTESLRRRRPENITQGLMQGLSEFGISILGALGGLAYHPIQYAVAAPGSPTSLSSSLGKSVMGVISRPLSGAAELVSLTGEGFLSSVGWTSVPQLRPELDSAQGVSSTLKHSHLPLLCIADATLYTESRYCHVILLMTSHEVLLVEEDGGDVIKRMELAQVRVCADAEDDTRLVLSRADPNGETEGASFAKSRVLSYVESTTSELFVTTPPSDSANQSAPFPTTVLPSISSRDQGHVLYLDATLRQHVVNVIEACSLLSELRR